MLKENSNSCYSPFAGQSVARLFPNCCGPKSGVVRQEEPGFSPLIRSILSPKTAENQDLEGRDFSSLYVLI